MSKLYAYLLGLATTLVLAGSAAAQAPVPPHRTCGTQEAEALQQSLVQKLNKGYDSRVSTNAAVPAFRAGSAVYTMPVVVHVINNGEAVGTGTNLSQAQINSQIDVLNEDYRNLNPDGATVVPSVFQPVRGDAQLQFVLATRDPDGNPLAEPGIDRVNSTTKGFTAGPYSIAYIDGTIKPSTYWNPEQYINIWVMNLGSNLLGYAQFPDNTANLGGLSPQGGLASTDGVVILYIAFGSRAKVPGGNYGTTANPYDKGRTLTHELGHFFGLRHVWGDSNCGDDYVPDTPTQQTSNYNCPTFPHVTCSNGPTGDQFMNYMDYVNDACMAMFSGGQTARVQAVMASNTPRRSNLVNSPVLCSSAVAAAVTGTTQVCAGGSISLQASGPAGATYAWTGPNGFTSTQQNISISNATTAMSGSYAVLVSAGSTCPQAARRTQAVTVYPVPATPTLTSSSPAVCPGTSVTLSAGTTSASALPSEDFNGAATGWTLANAGLPATAWQYRTAPYAYSSIYLTLSNFSLDGSRFALANSDVGGNGSVTNTTITSPVFSTMGHSQVQLGFQHVFRYQTGDIAVVEASTDGGTTWTTVASYTGTQGTATAPATASLSLNAFANQPTVQVRWRYNTSWSYFWALDNVTVTDPTPTPVYSYTVVSGNGLPTTTNTASITVSPTVNSVYQLTVGYAGNPCTSSATVAVAVNGAAVWTGTAGDGNWFNASNWQGCVPNRSTNATIPAGLSTAYPTISTGTAEVRALMQQGSLTVTGGQLNLYGDFEGTGTFTHTGGQVVAMASPVQTLRGGTYYDLAIAGTGNKTIRSSTITNRLIMSGAVLSIVSVNNVLGVVTLAPAATLVSESDASYVLGTVQTTHTVGTTADNFGNLGATIAATFAPGATTVVRNTSTAQGTGAGQSIQRYYDITPAVTRGLQGATLTLAYLPHELNGNAESQLALYRSVNAGSTWTSEGFTTRDATAHTVARNYVTDLAGRWTLAATGSALANGSVTAGIQAFPIPFDANGLSVQLTAVAAGPLSVQLYDMAGRKVLDQSVANVELGTSTVSLQGSGQLAAGKYVLRIQQAGQNVTMNVVRL